MKKYPDAIDKDLVGTYSPLCKSGGGYVYDDVLEYRVWYHGSGDDWYEPFATHAEAQTWSDADENREPPLVLVRQKSWIETLKDGALVHKTGERITEWRPQWLEGSKRSSEAIERILKRNADSLIGQKQRLKKP